MSTQFNELMTAYSRGIIDYEELAKSLKILNRERVENEANSLPKVSQA